MKHLMKPSIIMAFAALFLFIAGCKKDNVVIDPGPEKQQSSFRDFFSWRQSLPLPIQKFRLDVSRGGTIRGDRGYEFTIMPGTLVDAANNPIKGMVDIELLEVTNAYEMMASGAGTWAVNGILASIGMFSLTITQNGQDVFVNRNQPIQAMVTANPNAGIEGIWLFRGNADSIPTVLLEDMGVRWSLVNSNSGFQADTVRNVWDSVQRQLVKRRCIRFDLNFLRWCNLDKYINNVDGEQIVVEIPGIGDHVDTRVYMYLEQENLKGMVSMQQAGMGADRQRIFNSQNYRLPLGWQIRIIVVTRDKKGNLFYETRIITNASGAVHEFKDLKSISDEDLEAFFKGL